MTTKRDLISINEGQNLRFKTFKKNTNFHDYYSLTEVYFLGFSWSIKEGVHRKTHKACSGQGRQPARSRKGCFKIHRGFSLKVKKVYSFIRAENFALEKQTVFSLFCIFLKKNTRIFTKIASFLSKKWLSATFYHIL